MYPPCVSMKWFSYYISLLPSKPCSAFLVPKNIYDAHKHLSYKFDICICCTRKYAQCAHLNGPHTYGCYQNTGYNFRWGMANTFFPCLSTLLDTLYSPISSFPLPHTGLEAGLEDSPVSVAVVALSSNWTISMG